MRSFAAPPPEGLTLAAKSWRVIDGDTIQLVALGDRLRPHIRLIGVDCPEKHEPGGQEAADYTRDVLDIADRVLFYIPSPRDLNNLLRNLTFSRLPGYVFPCTPEGTTLNEMLILAGHATASP